MSGPRWSPADAPAPPGRLAAALRVPVFVAVSTLLGAAGHVVVERAAPPPRLLLLGLAVVAVCALTCRPREASYARITGTLLVGQGLLHLVLCLCHCAPGSALSEFVHTVLCPERAGGRTATGWPTDPLLVPRPVAGSGYLAHAYPGHAMLLAHLLAALAAGWWLRRGESAVWAALRAARPGPLPAPTASTPVAGRTTRPTAGVRPAVLHDQVAGRRTHPRRGPPLSAV